MINLSEGLARREGKLILAGVSVLATSLVAATFWIATPIKRLLGSTGINVVAGLMALIVASVGINFIRARPMGGSSLSATGCGVR